MVTLKKRHNQRKNKAVAPVLATLLMIAVAVAMSVIIFMWSQGFLAGTADSTGSQQGSQNQAAQSSIAIEASLFATGANSNGTVIVRNVGAVAVTVGNVIATGISSNTGFSGVNSTTDGTSLPKGASVNIQLPLGFLANDASTRLASGDVVTIKVTTDKGTFAQQSYTVP